MRNLTFTRLTDIDFAVIDENGKRVGTVTRFGRNSWAALASGGEAWTTYRRTRKEALADMFAGVTFLTYERR